MDGAHGYEGLEFSEMEAGDVRRNRGNWSWGLERGPPGGEHGGQGPGEALTSTSTQDFTKEGGLGEEPREVGGEWECVVFRRLGTIGFRGGGVAHLVGVEG